MQNYHSILKRYFAEECTFIVVQLVKELLENGDYKNNKKAYDELAFLIQTEEQNANQQS